MLTILKAAFTNSVDPDKMAHNNGTPAGSNGSLQNQSQKSPLPILWVEPAKSRMIFFFFFFFFFLTSGCIDVVTKHKKILGRLKEAINLYHSGGKFSRQQIDDIFLISPRNRSDISGKLII